MHKLHSTSSTKYVFGFFLILELLNVKGNLLMTNYDNSNKTETAYVIDTLVYNILPWDVSTAEVQQDILYSMNSSSTVSSHPYFVSIDFPFESYDPCNENLRVAVSPSMVTALLDLHYSSYINDMHDDSGDMNFDNQVLNKNNWFALIDYDKIQYHCGKLPMMFRYPPYASYIAQSMGARGVLWIRDLPVTEIGVMSRIVPPGTDIVSKTVFSEEIKIPALGTAKALMTSSESVSVIEEKSPVMILFSEISLDSHGLEFLFEPFSAFQIFNVFIALFSFVLGIIIIVYGRKVVQYYQYKIKDDKKARTALQMRLLILIPEFVACIFKILVAYDPVGGFRRVEFFTSRVIFNLQASLTTFTDVITIIFCADVLNIFRSAAKLNSRPALTFLQRRKYAGSIIIVAAALMVGLDIFVLLLGLFGSLGPTSLIPLLYTLVVTLAVVLVLLRMTSLMRKEVRSVLEALKSTDRNFTHKKSTVTSEDATVTGKYPEETKEYDGTSTSSTVQTKEPKPSNGSGSGSGSGVRTATNRGGTGSNNHCDIIVDRSERLLRMRGFLFWTVVGRFGSILGYGLAGSGWFVTGTFNYGFTMCLLSISSLFASFGQIFAALQLPYQKRSQVVASPIDTPGEV